MLISAAVWALWLRKNFTFLRTMAISLTWNNSGKNVTLWYTEIHQLHQGAKMVATCVLNSIGLLQSLVAFLSLSFPVRWGGG